MYSNVSYKCSSPEVVSFGDSDHDLIGFTRLSKKPPEVTRTIRKRSYKFFDKEQFLCDVADVDWTEVLCSPSLDEATMIFTKKFKDVLNFHAPWTIYQNRKHHKVWITNETRILMKERDRLKEVATKLAVGNRSTGACQEELDAWKSYRTLRNKINNLKKNYEHKY